MTIGTTPRFGSTVSAAKYQALAEEKVRLDEKIAKTRALAVRIRGCSAGFSDEDWTLATYEGIAHEIEEIVG